MQGYSQLKDLTKWDPQHREIFVKLQRHLVDILVYRKLILVILIPTKNKYITRIYLLCKAYGEECKGSLMLKYYETSLHQNTWFTKYHTKSSTDITCVQRNFQLNI